MTSKSHRGTIYLEDSVVLAQEEHAGRQFILRVEAPKCARAALPGNFAHVTCDPAVPMRRPLSIMRADPEAGWIEFLYKIVGEGLGHLSSRRPGDRLSILGPIGKPFALHPDRLRPLLIGGGVGIPPMLFVAEDLHKKGGQWQPFVIMGSELPFPFPVQASQLPLEGLSPDATHGMASLETLGIPSRLASWAGLEGSHKGFVTDLARQWLDGLSDQARDQVEIMACGPTPMLRAVAQLARDYSLPCQVSLEEFMACAVGGCAGCTVPVKTDEGVVMKRVCVDGPVFEARDVFPPAA
jgi:dihydroorotate dehydrogenase electron transfer subunit